MSVLLDTHVWIWWLTPGDRLPGRDRARLDELAARSEVHLSAISLWEAQMLHARRRIELPGGFAKWIAAASGPDVINLVPLDAEVIVALDELPGRFHGDPADRIIAATARCKGMPLATWDKSLRRLRSIEIWRA
ncbi:MAG: type II toxin-antitoxin system VapC family toxin [Lysobacter sp.]|nr:type II toxin-antitoxin system VapC family toxin [Lysobacter sp.]